MNATKKPTQPRATKRQVSVLGPVGPVSFTPDELRANLRQGFFNDVYLAEIAAMGKVDFYDNPDCVVELGRKEAEYRSKMATNAAVRAVKAFDEHA